MLGGRVGNLRRILLCRIVLGGLLDAPSALKFYLNILSGFLPKLNKREKHVLRT